MTGRPKTPLQSAQRLWRVCAAIERAFAEMGHRAGVYDVARIGGFAKGVFYAHFSSMDDAIDRMLDGVDHVCSMLARANAVDELAFVYEDFLLRFPHLECMVYATGERQIASYRRPVHSWGTPLKLTKDVTNTELLAWARYIGDKREDAQEGTVF